MYETIIICEAFIKDENQKNAITINHILILLQVYLSKLAKT